MADPVFEGQRSCPQSSLHPRTGSAENEAEFQGRAVFRQEVGNSESRQTEQRAKKCKRYVEEIP
ncbi:MAG: hypothetical protein D6679_04360 [Candidatus Hydrogenedentota bacterium]|nr:MAG: hypothetical protein D6679_04360 [Candidatus Hydrogenedentota bacterium]